MEFDTFIQRTKKTYQDARASSNLGKLNDELKDVTQVMTKNIEDLLYRGDSLERMGDMSQRLREDSKKYRKAAAKINWELLLKQVGYLGCLSFDHERIRLKFTDQIIIVWSGWWSCFHYDCFYLVALLLMSRPRNSKLGFGSADTHGRVLYRNKKGSLQSC